MDVKEDEEAQDEQPSSSYVLEQPPSPYEVLREISQEAFKLAGEAIHSAYSSNSGQPVRPPVHRRCQSELLHNRDGSFKFKNHMQKSGRSQCQELGFNYELLANQKRQWYQIHSKAQVMLQDDTTYKEPTSLFEHFIVVGLHSDTNLKPVEDAFAQRKMLDLEVAKSGFKDYKIIRKRWPKIPTLEPQLLYKYPPGKRLTMRSRDLVAFCFPGGVKAKMVERTPSLSDLNELFYGQGHLARDDSAFIFSFKAADSATLYGVCFHVQEIVQKPPGILGPSSPLSHLSRGHSRFLVSAHRCYCVLTRVPFFELHFEMLNSILSQERLNRITQFVNEMTLAAHVPSFSKLYDRINENAESSERSSFSDWMASAIPVDSAAALAAAAAGMVPDDGISSSPQKICDPPSPGSGTTSEASDLNQIREVDKDGQKNMNHIDDYASEVSETHSDLVERISGTYEYQPSPDVTHPFSRSQTLDRIGSFDTLFSPARSMASDEEDDDLFPNSEISFGDDLIMEWAKENKNELLQIVCGYHALSLPPRGESIVFHPLEHLQAIEYRRAPSSALGFCEKYLRSLEAIEVSAKLGAAEEAYSLSIWATAAICRVLSLESILTLVAGVLLEKQVVVVCPNLGVLSATVLSLVPMIRPFQWQCLLLPVLPEKMIDFIDAPVPFILGLQNKPADLKLKTVGLVQVNVLKDQVKTRQLPALPRHKELMYELTPFHGRLSRESSIAERHPIYRCSQVQANAASQFLTVMRCYLESLCSNLRSHTITSVQSNNDRVSLLLKDSFIDSFPNRDRPFIKLLVDTQMFTVLSDARLSCFELENS